jgi:hypothetical protein
MPRKYFFDYLQTEVGGVFHNFIDTFESSYIALISDVSIPESDMIYESWRPLRLGESAEYTRAGSILCQRLPLISLILFIL